MPVTFDTNKYFEYIAALEAERAARDFMDGAEAGNDAPQIEFLSPRDSAVELSIIIPAWNPNESDFERCLASVAAADFAGLPYEVIVSDDASPTDVVARCVNRAGIKGLRLVRQPKNLGGFGNFNWCISPAPRRWIHMLHQDDWIEPSFYRELLRGPAENVEAPLRFCRTVLAEGTSRRLMFDESPVAGLLPDFRDRQSMCQRIQISGAICAREVFAAVGGYDARLGTGADWELWARIAARYPVYYSPKTLATFSLHSGSWSGRESGGEKDAISFAQHRLVLLRILRHVPPPRRRITAQGFYHVMLQRLVQSGIANKRTARLPLNRRNVEALLVGCRDAGLAGDVERVLATL